ncbi:MAG: DUF4363 family protein [Clostridia bacterium]|nr:DUF4363 family protein [Clostridia bacterium]
MSRLIIAIILAVALIALSGFSYYFVNNAYKTVSDNIELCKKAFLSGENTVNACQNAKDDWEKKGKILDLFTPHSITDEISESLARLYPLAETESDEFLAECAKIKQKVKIIKRDFQINLRSIF